MKKSMFLGAGGLLVLGLAGCGAKQTPESPEIQKQRLQSQTSGGGERKQVAPIGNSGATTP